MTTPYPTLTTHDLLCVRCQLKEIHLRKAVHQLREDKDKKALYVAARIRSSMDWADGMNWSRYYNIRSRNYGARPLSLGRVQTATLALLVDRAEAIARFVPSAYFELKATMNLHEGKHDLFQRPSEDNSITKRSEHLRGGEECL